MYFMIVLLTTLHSLLSIAICSLANFVYFLVCHKFYIPTELIITKKNQHKTTQQQMRIKQNI